jgi:hypothetical protein
MGLLAPWYALEDVSAAHDYLYRMREVHGRPRAEADAVLFADDSDPTWLQYAAWVYCRAFGWIAWYDYDDAIKDILPL